MTRTSRRIRRNGPSFRGESLRTTTYSSPTAHISVAFACLTKSVSWRTGAMKCGGELPASSASYTWCGTDSSTAEHRLDCGPSCLIALEYLRWIHVRCTE